MKRQLILISALCIFLTTACQNQFVKDSSFKRTSSAASRSSSKKMLTLVTWNVQTFFDAVTCGTEYQEFKNSERWNKEKYAKRLEKLCDIMITLNPDIFVMEEIENEAVVQDISNMLAGNSWNNKKTWQYACFTKDVGSAIGCAVFSRYELTNLKTHSLDIRTQTETQPSMRPVMEVTVYVEDEEVSLFVNHWKSKSGGEEETEIWRDWQELVLADVISDSLRPVIICGDFNRSAEDFILQKNPKGEEFANTILRGTQKQIHVYSPWFRPDGKLAFETGSYYYDKSWEQIDNIMLYGNISFEVFEVVKDAPLTDENEIPLSYKVYTGEGYSDHLPLKCAILIKPR